MYFASNGVSVVGNYGFGKPKSIVYLGNDFVCNMDKQLWCNGVVDKQLKFSGKLVGYWIHMV